MNSRKQRRRIESVRKLLRETAIPVRQDSSGTEVIECMGQPYLRGAVTWLIGRQLRRARKS